MTKITEISASSILTPQKVGSLASSYDFSLNPYAGCAFSCSYCYVPKFPNARHEFNEWGKWVEVKVNAPELLQKERTRIFGSRIFFSSATDPYQYLEIKYRLSRRCLEQLLIYQPQKVTMHTRSHLILQDLPLLKQFGKSLSVGVSLTTDDEEVRAQFEPHAPSIGRRVQLIRKLREAGVEVYVSMSPLLPCDPDRLISLVAPYVSKVWIDTMRWTEVNTHPELLEKYKEFFEQRNYEATVNYIASRFPRRLTSDPPLSPVQIAPVVELFDAKVFHPIESAPVVLGTFDPSQDYVEVAETNEQSVEQESEKQQIISLVTEEEPARVPVRAAASAPRKPVGNKPQKKLATSSATQLKLPFA
ncbi:MAG TPA: radical SAM protein [Drouetiella sp.]